jgi:hypothetical protein
MKLAPSEQPMVGHAIILEGADVGKIPKKVCDSRAHAISEMQALNMYQSMINNYQSVFVPPDRRAAFYYECETFSSAFEVRMHACRCHCFILDSLHLKPAIAIC